MGAKYMDKMEFDTYAEAMEQARYERVKGRKVSGPEKRTKGGEKTYVIYVHYTPEEATRAEDLRIVSDEDEDSDFIYV